jgi:hypothetical protein
MIKIQLSIIITLYIYQLVFSQTTNTNSTESTLECNQIIPTNSTQCLIKSTSKQTCCFNKNLDTTKANECSQVQFSVSKIINGTVIRKENGNFTQICSLDSSATAIPKTCGKDNPAVYDDCLITDNLSFLQNSYWCCFSKITVSGRSVSACLPTETKAGTILSYKNAGLDYMCMGANSFASSSIIYFSKILILLLIVIIFF